MDYKKRTEQIKETILVLRSKTLTSDPLQEHIETALENINKLNFWLDNGMIESKPKKRGKFKYVEMVLNEFRIVARVDVTGKSNFKIKLISASLVQYLDKERYKTTTVNERDELRIFNETTEPKNNDKSK